MLACQSRTTVFWRTSMFYANFEILQQLSFAHHKTEIFIYLTSTPLATCCGTIMISMTCFVSITVVVTCLGSWMTATTCLACIKNRSETSWSKNRGDHARSYLTIFHDGVGDLPRLHDCGCDLLGYLNQFGDLLGNHDCSVLLRLIQRNSVS